jgi:hypothetical protein
VAVDYTSNAGKFVTVQMDGIGDYRDRKATLNAIMAAFKDAVGTSVEGSFGGVNFMSFRWGTELNAARINLALNDLKQVRPAFQIQFRDRPFTGV